MRRGFAALAAGAVLLPLLPLSAQPVPRQPPVSGTIIRTRSGETAQLVPSQSARPAVVLQQLKAGDVLRTNANGTLAIVFADQTQIRLGRNAVLQVREVRGGQPSALQLQRGRIWGRSPSGRTRLSVETPSATAAIRGTEWSLDASEERTSLQVFEGAIDFFNEAGSLAVEAGQAATARPGEAPTRVVLVNRDGREQMLYFLSREEGLSLLSGSAAVRDSYRRWFEAEGEEPPFNPDDPYSHAGRAFLAAWRGELDAALAAADAGLERFPDSSVLHEVKARVALLRGDGALAAETVAAALARDPDDAAALALRAEIALAYLGEPYAALADAERAVEADGERAQSWATLADIRLERDALSEAAAAIDRAIALAPEHAGLHARRAFILLRQNRVRAARRSVERALALDPSLSIVRTALARYHVQTGDGERALDELLAASADNPAYARALIALAESYYRAGDEEAARQQLDAADRLDPADPLTPLARTAIALDRYAADEAIVGAREALRRFRARGGVYSNLSENRTTGSYVSEAFRFIGLEGWGRYYGDRVFDSFTPSSYFDQALNQTASPFIQAPREYYSERIFQPFDTQAGEDLDSVSSFIQGLLLDPLSVTASERTPQFSNERFLEAHGGVRGFAVDGRHRTALFGGIDGILHAPVPFGFSLDLEAARERNTIIPDRDFERDDPLSGTGYFGAELTPRDRIVLFGSARTQDRLLFGPTIDDSGAEIGNASFETEARTVQAFGFWSHSFGARNMLTVGGGLGRRRSLGINRIDEFNEFFDEFFVDITRNRADDSFNLLTAAYARSIGRVDLKAGVELVEAGFQTSQEQAIEFSDGFVLELFQFEDPPRDASQQRYYLDARFWPRGAFQFQAHAALVKTRDARFIDFNEAPTSIDLRLGAAWEPRAGQWLRLALGRNTPRQVPFTIAPSTTLGLRENLLPAFFELLTPTDLAGQVDSVIARWDSEWSPHLFTAIEYQHQRFGHFPISSPDAQIVFFGDNARIHRVSASANVWATGNIGLAFTGAWTKGERAEPGADGGTFLPFLPDLTGRASVVWTNERRISARLTANYVGRAWTSSGARLDDYVVANAGVQWEPLDKRVELRLDLFNILDSNIRTSEIGQGPGRAISGSALVRF